MFFLRLTDFDSGIPIRINFHYVSSYTPHDEGGTVIQWIDGEITFVRESVDTIDLAAMGFAYQKAS